MEAGRPLGRRLAKAEASGAHSYKWAARKGRKRALQLGKLFQLSCISIVRERVKRQKLHWTLQLFVRTEAASLKH